MKRQLLYYCNPRVNAFISILLVFFSFQGYSFESDHPFRVALREWNLPEIQKQLDSYTKSFGKEYALNMINTWGHEAAVPSRIWSNTQLIPLTIEGEETAMTRYWFTNLSGKKSTINPDNIITYAIYVYKFLQNIGLDIKAYNYINTVLVSEMLPQHYEYWRSDSDGPENTSTYFKKEDFIIALIYVGADTNFHPDNYNSYVPSFIQAAGRFEIDIAQILALHGADINQTTFENDNALHILFQTIFHHTDQELYIATVQELVRLGVDICARNDDGHIPATLALVSDNLNSETKDRIMEIFLSKGPCPPQKNEGNATN